MISDIENIPLFSSYLFWDVERENLDFDKQKRFVIERV
jgi:hypothetical protein